MMVWSLTYSQTSWSVKSSGSIIMNKASRRDAIPAKLFQILRAVHNISANFENSSVASGLEKAQF